MNTSFPAIGGHNAGIGGENSFWPSFTDIMMVVTMIFLMATSLLVVRNWQLVAELQESVAAERIASQIIESTSMENATLEERLVNAEQSNSILRLRLLKKDEEIELALSAIREQETSIATLELRNLDLKQSLDETQAQLDAAYLEIDTATAQYLDLSSQIANLSQQLALQTQQRDLTQSELEAARGEIAALSESSAAQQLTITQLSQEKTQLSQQKTQLSQEKTQLSQEKVLLRHEIESYNQQLLTLKGDYETVKSKYEELIKPARTARGKYIAEVYYTKGESGNIIRYRQPGGQLSQLSLEQVEKRLDKLKQEQGKNLYVKIIIPENSGLTYNEAWQFMRGLLVKYDYYYQE